MSGGKKKFGDNHTDYLVLAFIILMVSMLAYCETAAADWSIEEQHDSNAGSTAFNAGYDRICGRYTFDTGTGFYGCPVTAVGGKIKSGWELGLTDELFPRWEGEIRLQQYDGIVDGGGSVRRMIGDGPFQLGLGLSYWVNESPGSNSAVTFNLSLRYTF